MEHQNFEQSIHNLANLEAISKNMESNTFLK